MLNTEELRQLIENIEQHLRAERPKNFPEEVMNEAARAYNASKNVRFRILREALYRCNEALQTFRPDHIADARATVVYFCRTIRAQCMAEENRCPSAT